MRALIGGRWRDDVLDYTPRPGEHVVQVAVWQTLEPLRGLYFERPRSLRMVLTYLREFGLRQVVRKVTSRAEERGRNEKYVAWGVGRVVQAPDDSPYGAGAVVAFLAPAHPACAERVTLPEALLAALPPGSVPDALLEGLRRLPGCGPPRPGEERWWDGAAGWSPFSGLPAPRAPAERLRERVVALAEGAPAGTEEAPGPIPTPRRTTRGSPPPTRGRPGAVLFGYGNYAKTAALPGVAHALAVRRVHEIDPTQIPEGDAPWVWDTSPDAPGEEHDAWLIAGFHHTHAPLAVEALERGAYAVVEKPVVVDREQMAALLDAAGRHPRVFACFHRRYSPLNEMALEDLGVKPGGRVDYHCIVSEVELPPLHWYRWPRSGSRLVANGCHWIDHFLYLNAWAAPTSHDVFLAPDGTVSCAATLENGAVFSMALTERGSERIGLQDHVELRSRDATVRIEDSTRYVADGRGRILRRTRSNRFEDHRRMYRRIAEAIQAGEAGDPLESLRHSCGLVLDLEDRLQAAKRAREGRGATPARPGHGA